MVISVLRSIQKQAVPCLFPRHKFLFNICPKESSTTVFCICITRILSNADHCRWLSQKSRDICCGLFNLLKLQCFLEKVELPLQSEKLSNYETFGHHCRCFQPYFLEILYLTERRKNHVNFFMYMVNLINSVNYMIALI